MTPTRLSTTALAAILATAAAADAASLRIATFNASMNRGQAGQLRADLESGTNAQLRVIAEIIQRVNPDVLLINEFDYDAAGDLPALFNRNYLAVAQNNTGTGASTPVSYAHSFVAPSNTGVASGKDLNNNGVIVTTPGAPGYGDDALGFGLFPGQFGMAVLSKPQIDVGAVRTFQNFLWKDMPGARLPADPLDADGNGDTASWYTPDELAVLPLSSKSHWDVPILVGGQTVHLLASHPTPPVFDGAEDRNGQRNADEIRFWSDYIGGAGYIYDDAGGMGGLADGALFAIAGDLNADPNDGDGIRSVIAALLANPRINGSVTPSSAGGPDAAARQGGANVTHTGDPAFDTADFADGTPGNLRADYVLPSASLDLLGAGVFWPAKGDPVDPVYAALVGDFPFPGSDHRLVWVDVALPTPVPLPGTLPLLFGGLVALGLATRRRG